MSFLSEQRKSFAGFTLIELLIVVAIIAILAAIAVPNFLEAQARAKTARVKADMRTIATAIEAYMVDESVYPIGWAEGVITYRLWNWVNGKASNFGPYRQLTTPVAYMSSIPTDPFAIYAQGNTGGSEDHFGWYYHWEGRWRSRDPRPIDKRGYHWSLRSIGPSRRFDGVYPTSIMAAGGTNHIYDPTNGTKSLGWIVMTNKGFYAGGPY